MRWERLFADLEARMAADDRVALEGDVADLVRAERARITVQDRLRAHLGERLTWSLAGADAPRAGRLVDIGSDWILIGTAAGEVLIPIRALQWIGGLSRIAAPDAGEIGRRLGIGVILRGLSRDRALVTVHLSGHRQATGTIDRVGADRVDLAVHPDDEPRRSGAVREVRCLLLAAVVGIAVR